MIPANNPDVHITILETIYENPKAVTDKAITYLMGILIKKTFGRVDPKELEEELKKAMKI